MSTKYNASKLKKLPILNRYDPAKKLSEAQEKHLREICTYEFSNTEEAGQSMGFTYGSIGNKMKFEFNHGEEYDVPRFIAHHVESSNTPIWNYKPDGNGSMAKNYAGKSRRFTMREVY